MKKEIIFFQGEEILNKFDEKRIFGKELTNAQNKSTPALNIVSAIKYAVKFTRDLFIHLP